MRPISTLPRQHRQARTRAIRQEMRRTGVRYTQAAKIVDAATGSKRTTVHTTAIHVSTSIAPFLPYGGLLEPHQPTLEETVAVNVAASAVALVRRETREMYSARAQVAVQAAFEEWPGLPVGWVQLEMAVLVTARRPWHIEGEHDRVQEDMADASLRVLGLTWPGLAHEPAWRHTYLPLDTTGQLFPFADHVRSFLEYDVPRAAAVAETGPDPDLDLGAVDYGNVWPPKSAEWMEKWEDYRHKVKAAKAVAT
ncbi:hypothetical protein ABZ502_17430 [Streptomyces abikoensis]|uniref:hypothetical protein n=1 Tax=Streptomyces abikoensis TaxID=97398 RepID=UPI0033E6B604